MAFCYAAVFLCFVSSAARPGLVGSRRRCLATWSCPMRVWRSRSGSGAYASRGAARRLRGLLVVRPAMGTRGPGRACAGGRRQGSAARFLFRHAAARRTSGSNVCSTHQTSSDGAAWSAVVWKGRGARSHGALTMPSLWLGSRVPPKCRTAARTVHICVFLLVF